MVNKMEGAEMHSRYYGSKENDFETIEDMLDCLEEDRMHREQDLKRIAFAKRLVKNLDACEMQEVLPHIESVSASWYVTFKTDSADSAKKLQSIIEDTVNWTMHLEDSERVSFDIDFEPEESFTFVSGKKVPAMLASWSLLTRYEGMRVTISVTSREIIETDSSSLAKTSDNRLLDTVMLRAFVDIARDAGLSAEQAKKMFESMSAIFDVKMREDD